MIRAARWASLIVALVTAPVTTRAADCTADATQTDLNLCADRDFQQADATLNSLYKQVVDRLKADPAATELLVQAQRSWLAFRDAECAFSAAGVATGSVHPMAVSQCRRDATGRRIADLRRYLACAEGDLNCPVPAR